MCSCLAAPSQLKTFCQTDIIKDTSGPHLVPRDEGSHAGSEHGLGPLPPGVFISPGLLLVLLLLPLVKQVTQQAGGRLTSEHRAVDIFSLVVTFSLLTNFS